ncbi:MAG: hypothetical protein J3R72DRAFT_137151 [Linnemannia gamsii]|nr:MAG: hypothetical protein J3R72DRAFT_137151 [Linnemannia gamsii]
MEEIADRTEVVLLDDLNPTSLSLSNMIHTSLNGFESGLIRSAITSTATTSSSSATATATSTATTTAAGTTTTATGTGSDSTLPTELRLKDRLQRIIRTPPSVAQTHSSNNNNNNSNSNKATASTSTNSTNNPDSSTPTTTPKRGLGSRVEKKLLVGVTAVGQDGKSLLVTTAAATATPTTRLGSGTDSSAPLPLPAAPVSDSSPDSSEKETETIKVDQHLHNYPFYYSPDPMPQRQLYTVRSSLLAKAKVKARAIQNNLLSSSPPPLPSPPHQQDEHDPLTKLELHKGNQEEGADGRGSNNDGTDVESNASNSNSNTISVGTSQHLKSFHHHHHRHHHRSSVQHDNIIMSDSDPQPDNSHDPSNDSDSTVTDHHPHEALLSPPTPRSRRCSIRSGRDSIGPDHDDERPSSPVLLAAAGTTAAPMTPAATPPLSLPKEIAAGVQKQQQKEAEVEDIVASLGEKADTISKTLVSDVSFKPTAMMTTPHDSAALYEAIFQRQHLTEDAIAGSLHELRQLILAYGIPEQVQY